MKIDPRWAEGGHLKQLDALERMDRIRKSKSIRSNLRALIAQLGQPHSRPLVRALTDLGFEGIAVAMNENE